MTGVVEGFFEGLKVVEIIVGGGHPNPEIGAGGGGGSDLKFFFCPFGPHSGLKTRMGQGFTTGFHVFPSNF